MLQQMTSTEDELLKQISEMLAKSYVFAYRGHMSDTYLNTIHKEYWYPVLKQSIAKGHVCLIEKKNEMIFACAVYEVQDQIALLHALYLHPELIGKGYGTLFYQSIEKMIIKHGCTSILLEVLQKNRRAVSFYERFGFQISDTFDIEEHQECIRCYQMSKTWSDIAE